MKKLAIFAMVLALIATGVSVYCLNKIASVATAAAPEESAYDRVMRTGVIRCGYAVWAPSIIKDPNTGEFSGIFYEYVEALAKALSLKVEWSREISFADFPEAVRTHQIDSMCTGIWPSAPRARVVDFTDPIYFVTMNAYARADDARFDNNIAAIDNPGVTLATIEGATSSIVTREDFPLAKTDALPQLTDQAQPLLEVATNKADVTIADSVTAAGYMANNPGKLKQVPAAAPIRLFGNTMSIPAGDDKLRRMLDTATEEMLNSGQIERIVKKYETYPGTLARVAAPYRAESK
jgi:polar amino acid transport system substrate-binding protein